MDCRDPLVITVSLFPSMFSRFSVYQGFIFLVLFRTSHGMTRPSLKNNKEILLFLFYQTVKIIFLLLLGGDVDGDGEDGGYKMTLLLCMAGNALVSASMLSLVVRNVCVCGVLRSLVVDSFAVFNGTASLQSS